MSAQKDVKSDLVRVYIEPGNKIAEMTRAEWQELVNLRTDPARRSRATQNGHANGKPDVGITADALMKLELPAPRYAIEDVVPEGLCILAGRPKTGKSWLALGWALAVAGGGKAMQRIQVEPGDVLYLALEDNRRRLQRRLRKMLRKQTVPSGLHLHTQWPRADDGGLAHLELWLHEHQGTRLVVIDTLARFRAAPDGKRSAYDQDYQALATLVDLAGKFQVAIVVLHHDRKLEAEDWIDRISGTLGLAGAADALLGLFRTRGEKTARLMVTGRDIEEADLGLLFHPLTCEWELMGNAEETLMSRSRREIHEYLAVYGLSTPVAIADATGKNRSTIRNLLTKMLEEGQVSRDSDQGLYYIDSVDRHNTVDSVDSVDRHNALSTLSMDVGRTPHPAACPACGEVTLGALPGSKVKCACGQSYVRAGGRV